MKTAFIIALVLVGAMANTAFLGSNKKMTNMLRNIDSNDFGKNLLDTIALQMQSGSPMNDIANLIRDMMNDLRAQQQSHDEAHSAKMGECADQIANYNARISHATNEIQEATQAIKSLRSRRRQLIKDIATGEKTLVMLEEQEVAARAKRAQDSKDFFARQEQTKLVLDALEVIIPKLRAITPHTASEVFVELAKLGASNPIQALVEVASSLDGAALAKCIGLLEQLQVDFTAFLDDDVEAEIQAQVNFDNLMIAIAQMRKETQEKLAMDRSELAEVEAALVNQKRRLAENQQELQNASDGLAAKTQECELYDAAYKRDTEQRGAELDILEQVAQIVASRLSSLNVFLEQRG
jgi:septal ring factor EnvC (AmiA/AmiB activator)